MRKLNIALSIVAFITILASCKELTQVSNDVAVSGITLSEEAITLFIDEEKTLSVNVLPADATDKSVNWSSSDDSVAVVKNGTVKGVSRGEAVITAKAGDKTAFCNVAVMKPSAAETRDVVGKPYKTADLGIKVLFKYAKTSAVFEDAGVLYGKSRIVDIKDADFRQGVLERGEGGVPQKKGYYIVRVQDLEEETKYYYMAYACFDGEYHLGGMKSFTTSKFDVSTEKSVDLGLSVKWAAWNVGASKPEEFGDYFVWGVSYPYENTLMDYYKWFDNRGKIIKYNTRKELGKVDGKTVLELIDDAAAYNWEEKWRMPTEKEKMELLRNTVQSKFTYKGVPGYVFTSKKNGASIFFPASGYSYAASVKNVGTFTAFWTSTLSDLNDRSASFACDHVMENGEFLPETSMISKFGFYWETVTTNRQLAYRWYGFPVRPVWDEGRAELVCPPQITLDYPTEINSGTVKLNGKIKDFFRDKRTMADLPEFGFCLRKGLGVIPAISDIKVVCKASDGKQEGKDFIFSKTVSGLEADTDYSIAAYMMSGGSPSYASGFKFRTLIDLDPNLKEVDLGLPSGLKWAGWNLGATKATEFGDGYYWADRRSNPSSYIWMNNKGKFTKYILNGEHEFGLPVDNLCVMETSDDAATALWGKDWRIPTMAEFAELKANCTVSDILYMGVKGLLLTGPNGKSLFFPINNSGAAKYWSVNRRINSSHPYENVSEAHIMQMHYTSVPASQFVLVLDRFWKRSQKIAVRAVKSK